MYLVIECHADDGKHMFFINLRKDTLELDFKFFVAWIIDLEFKLVIDKVCYSKTTLGAW